MKKILNHNFRIEKQDGFSVSFSRLFKEMVFATKKFNNEYTEKYDSLIDVVSKKENLKNTHYIVSSASNVLKRKNIEYKKSLELNVVIQRWLENEKLLKLKNGTFSCSLYPEKQGYLAPVVSANYVLDQIKEQKDCWFTREQILESITFFRKQIIENIEEKQIKLDNVENYELRLPQINSKKNKYQRDDGKTYQMWLVAFLEYAVLNFEEAESFVLPEHRKYLEYGSDGICSNSQKLCEELNLGKVCKTTMFYRLQEWHNLVKEQLIGYNYETQKAMIKDMKNRLKSFYEKCCQNVLKVNK